MKKLVTIMFGVLISMGVKAQAFENGGNVITLGFGVDPYSRAGFNNGWGNGYKYSSVGPIMLTYERGITELLGIGRIGVGGGVGQSFYTSRWNSGPYESVEKRTRTAIFVKCAYHFDFGIDKMDVYAGVGGGAYINGYTYSSSDPDDFYTYKGRSGVTGGHYIFGGIRYYFTDAFGVYAEAGHGMTALNGGFSFKF